MRSHLVCEKKKEHQHKLLGPDICRWGVVLPREGVEYPQMWVWPQVPLGGPPPPPPRTPLPHQPGPPPSRSLAKKSQGACGEEGRKGRGGKGFGSREGSSNYNGGWGGGPPNTSWGQTHIWGLPKGLGPKSSVCPSKPRENKLFGGIYRSIQIEYRQTLILEGITFQLQIQNRAAKRIAVHYRDRSLGMILA